MKIINKENGESFETGIKTPFFGIDGKQLVTGDIVKLGIRILSPNLDLDQYDFKTFLVSICDGEPTVYGASHYDLYFKHPFETNNKRLNLLQLLKDNEIVYYLDTIGNIENLGFNSVDYNSWFYIDEGVSD